MVIFMLRWLHALLFWWFTLLDELSEYWSYRDLFIPNWFRDLYNRAAENALVKHIPPEGFVVYRGHSRLHRWLYSRFTVWNIAAHDQRVKDGRIVVPPPSPGAQGGFLIPTEFADTLQAMMLRREPIRGTMEWRKTVDGTWTPPVIEFREKPDGSLWLDGKRIDGANTEFPKPPTDDSDPR